VTVASSAGWKALNEHPDAPRRIEAGELKYLDDFVQEVRRTSPFSPFIGDACAANLSG
jgi:cytochrome P450